jgi:Reverse transcriptase (RNA-dependent DNA polymerase)
MLQSSPYVHIIALDFSKAFDTVRHHTLLSKFNRFPITDNLYNWLVSYFAGRAHSTKIQGITSPAIPINASIIQGSSIGPTSYVINASDLKTIILGNKMHKYADDTYLLIPSNNSRLIQDELDHIETWSTVNNLRLNRSKSTEMVVRYRRAKFCFPPPVLGLERVDSLNILGVTISCYLSMQEHITNLVISTNQALYALKIIKAHGISHSGLINICRATLISRLLYASCAWWGFATQTEIGHLQSVLSKAARWGMWGGQTDTLTDMFRSADDKLFQKVLRNPAHVLFPLLPRKKELTYNLRPRAHQCILPISSTAASKNFVQRMLFKHAY